VNVFFKVLGLLLAGYVVMAVLSGAVYAKSGVWGRTFRRMDRPLRYWSAIAAYTVLSVALMFWF
jgi:hypothetical protein